MSFFRPEATAWLRAWAEPAVYAAIAVFAGVKAAGLLANGAWTGAVLAAIALLAMAAFYGAVSRSAYVRRTSAPGPGVVSFQEARIIYMGPYGGAFIARDALIQVDIAVSGSVSDRGALTWILTDEAGQVVQIPGAADGAVGLLDMLGALPGFDHVALQGITKSLQPGTSTLWSRPGLIAPDRPPLRAMPTRH